MAGIVVLHEMSAATSFFRQSPSIFRTSGLLVAKHHPMRTPTNQCCHDFVGELSAPLAGPLARYLVPPEVWIVTDNPLITPCRARKVRVVYVPSGWEWSKLEIHRPVQIDGQQRQDGTVEQELKNFIIKTAGHTRICQCVNLPSRIRAECACQQQPCCKPVPCMCQRSDCATCIKAGYLWPVLDANNNPILSIHCLLQRLQTAGDDYSQGKLPRIPLG